MQKNISITWENVKTPIAATATARAIPREISLWSTKLRFWNIWTMYNATQKAEASHRKTNSEFKISRMRWMNSPRLLLLGKAELPSSARLPNSKVFLSKFKSESNLLQSSSTVTSFSLLPLEDLDEVFLSTYSIQTDFLRKSHLRNIRFRQREKEKKWK